MEYEQLAAFDFVAIMHLLVSYIVGMYCSNKDTLSDTEKVFSRLPQVTCRYRKEPSRTKQLAGYTVKPHV